MDIEKEFPLRIYINLGRREDRRRDFEVRAEDAGLTVERLPAVDARWLKSRSGPERRATGGHGSAERYAVGLTRRMVVRLAWRRGVRAVLIFEDDVVFAADFSARLAGLELPADWGMFYFGCLHVKRPTLVGAGLVRVARAVDTHAFAVRARHYREVIRASAPWGHRGVSILRNSDVMVSDLHATIPTYAALPNLAWQSGRMISDITGAGNGNCAEDGRKICWPEARVPMRRGEETLGRMRCSNVD